MDDKDAGGLLTIQQTADRLGRNRSTIKRWLREGTLAGVRIGNRTYVRSQTVQRIVTDPSPPSEPATAPPPRRRRMRAVPGPDGKYVLVQR
jgi:excisionase family DNA binding protein